MDYTAPYAKERLSGRAWFALASAPTQYADMGNIQMLEVDYGIKRKEHYAARRGILTLDRFDAYATMMKWQITADEFVTPTLPYFWLGTVNTSISQTVATAATFMFSSKKGFAFDVGKFGLNNASLTTPASKVEGFTADYVIDRGGGKVYIPLSSSIVDATACTVTYDAPALTYDSVNALALLNRSGTLHLDAEDDSQSGIGAGTGAIAPVRYHITLPCILSADKTGQFKPDDYRTTTLIATATGTMIVTRLLT
jgi:hypothetical protein